MRLALASTRQAAFELLKCPVRSDEIVFSVCTRNARQKASPSFDCAAFVYAPFGAIEVLELDRQHLNAFHESIERQVGPLSGVYLSRRLPKTILVSNFMAHVCVPFRC